MKLKSILKGFLTGALKAVPIVGNIATEVKEQVENDVEHSAKGKIDYARLFGYVIMAIIVVSVIIGKLDLEDAEVLIKKLNLFSFFQ